MWCEQGGLPEQGRSVRQCPVPSRACDRAPLRHGEGSVRALLVGLSQGTPTSGSCSLKPLPSLRACGLGVLKGVVPCKKNKNKRRAPLHHTRADDTEQSTHLLREEKRHKNGACS